MTTVTFVDEAKVMPKGRVTIPKKIRSILGVESGDRVIFIVEGNSVRIVKSAVYALRCFQEQMKGEAGKAGFFTEEDIDTWLTMSRREESME